MLPAAARLRRGADITAVVRRGHRASRPPLTVHLLARSTGPGQLDAPAQVAFVVGKAVGSAVTRNQVRRRLRHLVRDRLGSIPPGSRVVVRASGEAGTASYDDVRRALHTALDSALSKATSRVAAR